MSTPESRPRHVTLIREPQLPMSVTGEVVFYRERIASLEKTILEAIDCIGHQRPDVMEALTLLRGVL